MTTRPISFPPQKKEPAPFAPSAVQNNTVGPFSAPEILPQYSPPVRQLSFGSTNSAGHLVSDTSPDFANRYLQNTTLFCFLRVVQHCVPNSVTAQ